MIGVGSEAKLVYPELSYKIVGILFEVHNKLGGSYQEKYYQRAVAAVLVREKLRFEGELAVDLHIDEHPIGRYLLDFLIEDKIVLELKAKPNLHKNDFRQVRAYLRAKNLRLGILANFRGKSVEFFRILNPIT